MLVAKSILELKTIINEWKQNSYTIGFCPTMGTLHEGHMDLVLNSKKNTDKTIVSIFVNPTQFNDPKDFESYPVNTELDLELCEKFGVDLVFLPTKEMMYGNGISNISLSAGNLEKNLCGRTRPGHFSGVLLVVSKLFHLTEPNKVYFGLKDYQQFRIVSTLANELNFPIEVVGVPTKRDPDGLAKSSRNLRLTKKNREVAGLIPRMFELAKKLIADNEKDLKVLKEILSDFLLTGSELKIDYIEFVDPMNLETLHSLQKEVLLAVAVFVGEVRLIDNQILET